MSNLFRWALAAVALIAAFIGLTALFVHLEWYAYFWSA